MRTKLVAILIAATVALAACGEKDEPDISGPPVVAETGGQTTDTGNSDTGDGRGGVALEKIGEFDDPVYVTQPKGDNALYVVQQTGQIVRVSPRGKTSTFLDVSKEITAGGEQGLLSVAFAPDYQSSGRLYVDYTNKAGDTRVVEYRRDAKKPALADPSTARTLLSVDQPFANHNGGLLLFDDEGNLLIGLGDGGDAGDPKRNAQDLSVLLGKILRIDPQREPGKNGAEYSIPKDNPLVSADNARPEILVYGLRNPWRFSLDSQGGGLWIGDVGQNELEEVDFVSKLGAGANLGWSAYEGTERFNSDQQAENAIDPVLTYGRDEGCSITGGFVVRDRSLATLYGRYLYADFCQGQLRSFSAADALPGPVRDDVALGLQVPSISSFGEDQNGRIYAVSLDGPVFRLVPDKG